MKKGLKKLTASLLCAASVLTCCFCAVPAACATDVAPSVEISSQKEAFPLEDGVYSVKFDTDGSMFHVNDICEGRAELTVENGSAVLHLIMPSKNVLNLYAGLAEDAKLEGAELLYPGTTQVVYSDGYTETVYTYDVPVSVLGEEFDLALVGKKGTWYDHKVSISDPVKTADIKYVELSLEGGTGKTSVESPAKVLCYEDSFMVRISWSSKYYDYMIVDGVMYEPVSVTDCSVFEIPVKDISVPLTVIADTVAMSTPHEIEYVITFATEVTN